MDSNQWKIANNVVILGWRIASFLAASSVIKFLAPPADVHGCDVDVFLSGTLMAWSLSI